MTIFLTAGNATLCRVSNPWSRPGITSERQRSHASQREQHGHLCGSQCPTELIALADDDPAFVDTSWFKFPGEVPRPVTGSVSSSRKRPFAREGRSLRRRSGPFLPRSPGRRSGPSLVGVSERRRLRITELPGNLLERHPVICQITRGKALSDPLEDFAEARPLLGQVSRE